MSTPNYGGPAFPQHGWTSNPEVLERMKGQSGMTLRDWFAGQALAGLMACGRLGDLLDEDEIDNTPRAICVKSYEVADFMIKAREQ